MKKTTSGLNDTNEELQPEYDLDYHKSRPNRFANQVVSGGAAVVLGADVASVFRTSQAVNEILSALIVSMPKQV